MSDERILAELGPRFRVERGERVWWAVRAECAADLAEAGFGAGGDGELHASALVGRKPLFELRTPTSAYVVRRFSHGGLWRFATGRRFKDPSRPFREVCAAMHLERHGIATAEIAAARARRVGGPFWELDLVTRRIDDALDLGDLLGRARRLEVAPRVVSECARTLGQLVRRLHACGFFHADLTPNNVLVNASVLGSARAALTLLDLDRARVLSNWSDADRRANLRRLYRFIERREERDGRALRRTDYVRFFTSYTPEREAWKADWRAVARDHARADGWHRLGWLLERAFGKRRDVRERSAQASSSSSSPKDSSSVTRG
ncbi:MAG: hypothetical protein JNL28_04205 [Planctomycetes bacterium]|nr:hypothetical protein [Planctomycetota bacterium]